MTEPTYELEAVVSEHLPARWKPEYARRWLVSRLNRGELRGVRYGRWDWRMRESDIEFMLSRYSNTADTVAPVPDSSPASVADGLSERSRRRLRSA
ncbi:DNA-binding protein [Mycobacterium sp. 23]|uniref:DNA-binding protein n=1 Tax=Mycobacterium sp. 23 TaxID=3400424 RepID=UPI003AAFEAD1